MRCNFSLDMRASGTGSYLLKAWTSAEADHLAKRAHPTLTSRYFNQKAFADETFAEEIHRLSEVFQSLIPKVPEMLPLLASLRRYCMNESTFDENDFRGLLEVRLLFCSIEGC